MIDVQQGLFTRSGPIYQAERLLATINTLVARAHEHGAPVFYVQHCNKNTLSEGHSSYSQDAARLIEAWNGKLAKAGATVRSAAEVDL